MPPLVTDSAGPMRPLYFALYAIAAAFILPTLMEFLLVSFPYRPGAAQWRFGAIGLLFNSVAVSPLIGLTVAAFASVALGHWLMTRVIAVVALIVAVLLVVGVPLFALDFLQLRNNVNPALKRAYDYTSLKATITGVIMIVAATTVGIGAWRAAGGGKGAPARRAGAQRGVVVGATPAP